MARVIDMSIIRQMMKDRKLSLAEISRRTGLSKSYLSLMFSGQRNTSVKNLNKIIEALDMDIEFKNINE